VRPSRRDLQLYEAARRGDHSGKMCSSDITELRAWASEYGKPLDPCDWGLAQTRGLTHEPTPSFSHRARITQSYVLLTLACALAGSANAQFVQQGSKLVGAGAANKTFGARQGSSVALSADGNTAILGGPYDNYNAGGPGAAWVYTRSGGVWTQQGSKLVGTGAVGNAYQGSSVALSADGNTAILGGPNDNYNAGRPGAAWVFTRSGSVWTQQGSKLVGSGAVGNAWQGSSVALSADGNTAIVGGPHDNSNSITAQTGVGAVWVYTRSGGVWTQQGSKLVGTGAANTYTGAAEINQGRSVALSADGHTAIVGGDHDNSGAGAVWVYTRSGGVWTQQGSKLVGTGAVGYAYQGWSVALSADGNTAIVGGPTDIAFREPGGGGPDNLIHMGAAWVYTRSGGVWTQQGSKLVGTGAAGYASNQGSSVALSADASTALVGGALDNNDAGAAWVFVSAPTSVPPSISLSPTQLQFSYTVGSAQPTPQAVTVADSGGGTFMWSAASTASWLALASATGLLTVSVKPTGLTPGTYTSSISVTASGVSNSPQTIQVTLTIIAAPNTVTVTSVTNAASGEAGAISPGEIITIKGSGLGPATGVSFSVNPSSGNVDATLAGTRVIFNGFFAAPILYTSAGQVNAIVPYEIAPQTPIVMQVQYQATQSVGAPFTVVITAAPGIFTFDSTGSGQAAAANQDGSFNGPSRPAAKGSYVTIYFTGGGQTDPPGVTGSVTGAVLKPLIQTVSVRVGGQPAIVAFAGAAPTFVDGVGQLNIRLAGNTPSGSAQPVVIVVGGVSSPARATVAVQ